MSSEQLPYTDYGGVMRKRLGGRVQKLAIDASISCPNRDGGVAYGGCTFCLNEAFSPFYCREATSITEQIERGIAFHKARRREGDIYLAYLQSGSNTYGDIDHLERIYHETLTHPAISGIIIGTRPDCISSEILDILEHISKQFFVSIEYGIESTLDASLTHVNRGHTFAQARDTVALTRERNIECGAHFILGLPNETREQIVAQTEQINRLDIQSIKFHQLQIYRNTAMAKEWELQPERFLFAQGTTAEEYTSLIVEIIRHLKPSIAIERIASVAPHHLLLHSPLKGVRPDTLREMVISKMRALGATQGDLAK
jgi:radical SAM protein (TIGR01212 family)